MLLSPRHPLPLATLICATLASLALLAPRVPAEAGPVDAADTAFNQILGAVNSGTASTIAGFIPDGQTAKFKLKGAATVDLNAEKAAKELKIWFDGGAKGGGFTLKRGTSTGNPFATLQRKSDGKNVTVTLKLVKGKYYLCAFEEI